MSEEDSRCLQQSAVEIDGCMHLYTHLDYFMGLQETSCEEGGRVQVKDLLKYSRLYRSVLHECVLGLSKMARGQLDALLN